MIVETYKLTVSLVEYFNTNDVYILKAFKNCSFEGKKLKSFIKKSLRSNYAESKSWSNNWLFNLIFWYIFINLLYLSSNVMTE